MVLKKEKHGLHTGNTLRAINSKHTRIYRKESYIVRRNTTGKAYCHTDVSLDVFEGANIPCEGVLFSLNKNQRWLLPDLIKEAFHEDELFDTNKVLDQCPGGLELVERDKIIRNNNCISIHACKPESNKDGTPCRNLIKSERARYIDADNVLKTPPLYSNKDAASSLFRGEFYKGWVPEIDTTESKNSVDEGGELNKDSEHFETQTGPVRLEVLYPCESSGVLSVKPKLLGNRTKKTFKCRNYIRKQWTLEGYQFRRRPQKEKRENIDEAIKEGLDEFYDEQDVNYTELELEDQLETSYSASFNIGLVESKLSTTKSNNTETSYESKLQIQDKKQLEHDFKKMNNEVKTHLKEEPVENKEQDGDTSYFTQDELSSEGPEIDGDFDLFRTSIKTTPVSVLLKKDEIDVNELHDHYGVDYLECHTIPRRFVISISEYITDLDLDGIGSAYKLLHILNKKTFAWLIFVHDPVNKFNCISEEVFNVSLNANFKDIITAVRIEGLEKYSVVSITEIIGKTLKYLKDLPRESLIFEKRSSHKNSTQVPNSYSLLEKMKNWTTCTYVPDDSYVLKTLINSKLTSLSDKKSVAEDGSNIEKESIICTICFKTSTNALALLSCCHYFCNKCWRSHIQTKVNIGNDVIRCPNVCCNETVDTGMLISFLKVKDILIYARRRHNMDVERNRLAKWCSNESCGRVLLVNKLDVKTTRCTCGETMCFGCAGKPHWPLPCEQYLDYVEILIETRDKNITPHDFVLKFDGKYCRSCFKIILRYDRCHVANCICEGNLCLRCSFLWHTKNTNSKPKIKEKSVSFACTIASSLSPSGPRNTLSEGRRTKWYKLAFKHRLQQHPFRLAKVQASSKLLANRLSHYILREERKGNFIYLDFMENGDYHLRDTDKVTHYMAHIVHIYEEINNVIESCTFFLDKENDESNESGSLHRRAMILSTCLKTIYDLIKDGAFLNPKVVMERLKGTSSEIRRVMETIVKEF